MWLVGEGATFYVFSESKAGKVKRIRHNGRVSIAPCDLRGNLKSENWETGSAEIIVDPVKLDDIYNQFDSKYGWQMRLLNFIAKLNGRYHKRAVLVLKFESEPAS